MIARLILATLMAGALPVQAADRCTDLAAMYHLAHGLRDAGLRSHHTVEVEIQRYVRHGEHFVIFGMAPHRAAELIAELNK